MFIRPIDNLVGVWLLASLACAIWVAIDMDRSTPEPVVVKWEFILGTLYMGSLGLLIYVLARKEPPPGTHGEFVVSLWKHGIGDTIHCVAVVATGIIIAASIAGVIGYPMILDAGVQYLMGFGVGLFVFQALFMQKIMGGTWWENVRSTFEPEFISMNAVMGGMVPVMVLLMVGRDMRGMEPTELMFWGIMSVWVTVGFIVAYAVNVWMVNAGMKHGMMTLREPGSKFDVPVMGAAAGHSGHASLKMDNDPHAGHDMASNADNNPHAGHGMQSKSGDPFAATRAQVASLMGASLAMLALGMVLPAISVNMWRVSNDVGGLITSKVMIMDFDTPAETLQDMAAVHPRKVTQIAAADARGDTIIAPKMDGDVEIFDQAASVIRLDIQSDEMVDAYAYNGQVPGPRLSLTEGDTVRINFRDDLPEPSTIHWHGLIVPDAMDGPAEEVQNSVPTGVSFTNEYTVNQAATYFYHSHTSSGRQQGLGLYGALIVDRASPTARIVTDYDVTIQLQKWLKRVGQTYPSMIMEGVLPNHFTVNGKLYPDTETINMKVGESLRLRSTGTINNFAHPMHAHGGPYTVAAANRYEAHSVSVVPGQCIDVVWTAREPGEWPVHC